MGAESGINPSPPRLQSSGRVSRWLYLAVGSAAGMTCVSAPGVRRACAAASLARLLE